MEIKFNNLQIWRYCLWSHILKYLANNNIDKSETDDVENCIGAYRLES